MINLKSITINPDFYLYLSNIIQKNVIKPKADFIPTGINFVNAEIEKVDEENNKVILKDDKVLNYDFPVISTGVRIVHEETSEIKSEL